jgi:hypothetical protein
MANITDPSAVKFCNEQIRPSADKLVQLYWFLKAVKQQYLANPALATLIPNDGTAVVVDGSAQDGRIQITGADAQAIITNLNSLITSLEATSNAMLNVFSKAAVNIH